METKTLNHIVTVEEFDGSEAIRLPDDVLKHLAVEIGDEVEFVETPTGILIRRKNS
jgi:antitoxin component of MazEF toxin-antitoxin module